MNDNRLIELIKNKFNCIKVEEKNLIGKIDIIFLYCYIWDDEHKKIEENVIDKILKEILCNLSLIPISATYGLCKLGYALDMLSRHNNKYMVYKNEVNKIIKMKIIKIIKEIKGKKTIPLFYDSVNGLSGACRYMMCDTNYFYKEIISINDYFVDLALKTSNGYEEGFFVNKNEKSFIDLGMAHGIAGPLFILSLNRNNGIKRDNKDAIKSLIEIYKENIYFYNDKFNLNPYYDKNVELKKVLRKNSWCYGLNGISKAIELGANISEDKKIIKLSQDINKQCVDIDNLKIEYKEKTFCHGLSGVFHFIDKFTMNSQEKNSVLDNIEKDLINEIIQNNRGELSILDGDLSILIPILIRNFKVNNDIFSKIFMLE